MAWYLWVDDDKVGANCSNLSTLSEKSTGFQGGKAAVAKNVNVALRQANLVACALMDMIDSEAVLSYSSTREQIANAFIAFNNAQKVHLYQHYITISATLRERKGSTLRDDVLSATFHFIIHSTKSDEYVSLEEILNSFPSLASKVKPGETHAVYIIPCTGNASATTYVDDTHIIDNRGIITGMTFWYTRDNAKSISLNSYAATQQSTTISGKEYTESDYKLVGPYWLYDDSSTVKTTVTLFTDYIVQLF